MKAATPLVLAAVLASLAGCSAQTVDEDSGSGGAAMSTASTETLDRRLATFTGRWISLERRPDLVDVVVGNYDDERGGYSTEVRFETTNLVLRNVSFSRVDGGEIFWRSLLNDGVVEGTADSKLSSDGRTLTKTILERTTDNATKSTVATKQVQTLALEGDKLHFTDVKEGKKTADLFLEWDDKQPPRSSSDN